MKKIKLFAAALAGICLLTSGCAYSRIRPGHAFTTTSDGINAQAVQSQDPKTPMVQNITTASTDEQVIPAGAVIDVTVPGTTNVQHVTLDKPMPVKHTTSKTIETKVGGSQKNTMQEIAAKLASLRWLQVVGLILVLFGIASVAYPPIRLIVGSITTSVIIIASGGAMIILPVLIVGHELLILGVGAAVAGLWWFAHRHGGVTAELNLLKSELVSKVKSLETPAPTAPTNTTK